MIEVRMLSGTVVLLGSVILASCTWPLEPSRVIRPEATATVPAAAVAPTVPESTAEMLVPADPTVADSSTAVPLNTSTPTLTPFPSVTPTPPVPLSVTVAPSVLLLYPSPAAPTATVESVLPTPVWPPSPLDQTDNILVMGIDQRPGEAGWRTDTIMVVALDQQANQVGVMSVPRDLYVDLPGFGMGRINQADYFGETFGYPGGGPALLRRALTGTLGIPTEHYVRIRMEGLVQLVDALGGVTVTLDCPLYERTPSDTSPNGVEDWNLPAGPVHLDGESAKKFATYRYASTDFGRARRQQQLIWAIRDRALQVDILPRIPELWKAFSGMFSTDLSLLDVVKLVRLGIALQPDKVHGVVLGNDVMDYYVTPDGAWVLVVRDYERIAAEKAGLFAQRPLASFNVSMGGEGGECPPAPTPPPTFTPALPVAPEPVATPTATPSPP